MPENLADLLQTLLQALPPFILNAQESIVRDRSRDWKRDRSRSRSRDRDSRERDRSGSRDIDRDRSERRDRDRDRDNPRARASSDIRDRGWDKRDSRSDGGLDYAYAEEFEEMMSDVMAKLRRDFQRLREETRSFIHQNLA